MAKSKNVFNSHKLITFTRVFSKCVEVLLWVMTGAMVVFFIVSLANPELVLDLLAHIYVYLILQTADGKTWFAKSQTPFQADIVRMLREIGIFLISHMAVSTIAVIVITLIFPNVELSAGTMSFTLGLLMLCLAQFFNYGTELEQDTKGLI